MSRPIQIVGAAAAGGLVVGLIMWFARPPQTPVAPPLQVTEVAAPVASTAPTSVAAAPPWADSAATAPITLPDLRSSAKASPQKQAAREAIRQKIAGLTANGRQPTPAEMNVVLADLERVEGSSVISGINVGAVRNNLVKVDEMQRLGEQMKTESTKPGGGDIQKLNAMMARIQKLQSEMRLDITVSPPAPAPIQHTQK